MGGTATTFFRFLLSKWMGGCARGRGHGEEEEAAAAAAATGGHIEAPDKNDCNGARRYKRRRRGSRRRIRSAGSTVTKRSDWQFPRSGVKFRVELPGEGAGPSIETGAEYGRTGTRLRYPRSESVDISDTQCFFHIDFFSFPSWLYFLNAW